MPAPEQKCGNCKFFLELAILPQSGKGLCRYGPPAVVAGVGGHDHIARATADGRWALCFKDEWCGRWEREN